MDTLLFVPCLCQIHLTLLQMMHSDKRFSPDPDDVWRMRFRECFPSTQQDVFHVTSFTTYWKYSMCLMYIKLQWCTGFLISHPCSIGHYMDIESVQSVWYLNLLSHIQHFRVIFRKCCSLCVKETHVSSVSLLPASWLLLSGVFVFFANITFA